METTITERAASYLRVSTGQQAEKGYGLPEQQAKTAEHAARRGFRLLEEVRDEGISGRLDERPGLRRLLDLARTQAIDVVVAVNIKRLGRANRVIQDVLQKVRAAGVRVEFTEHPGGEKPAERLLENLLGSYAEFDWETIRQQTMDGRNRKAEVKQVNPNGKSPYGYRAVSKAESEVLPEFKGRDGEYLIVPEEAARVQELFQRAAAGETLGALARWMQATSPGGRMGSRSAIANCLRNPAYIGAPEYKKTAGREVDGKKVRVRRPAAERIKLQCPALVSEELFHAVGERLTQNQQSLRGRPPRPGKWVLRGCVFCGQCVRPTRGGPKACIGSGGRGSPCYVCRSDSGHGGCGTRYPSQDLEDLAREALRQAAAGALVAAERERAVQAAREAGNPQAAAKQAEKTLAEVDAVEERLLDQALTGGFNPALLAKKQAELGKRREAAEAALREARIAALKVVDPEEAGKRAERVAAALRENLEVVLADPEQCATWFRRLLKIVLHKDRPPLIEVRVPPGAGEGTP